MTKGKKKKNYLNLTSKYQSRCLHWQCLSQCCIKPMQGNLTSLRPLHAKSILTSTKEFLNTAHYQQNTGNQDSNQILLQDLFNWPKCNLGYYWVHLKAKKAYILRRQMYSSRNCLLEEDNAGTESTSNELWAVKNSCTEQVPMSDTGIQEFIHFTQIKSRQAYSLSYLCFQQCQVLQNKQSNRKKKQTQRYK